MTPTDNRTLAAAASQDPIDTLPASLSDLHCFTETSGVLTTTMFDVPGYRVVRVLGAVYGLTVRSRNWAASLGMVLKSVAGGELRWFTNLVCFPPRLYCERMARLMVGVVVHGAQRRHQSDRGRDAEPRGQRRDCAAV